MKRLALGVMGHVDHGKTALVRALTGMETDRLAEEQRRGVSIVLGFAHARFGDTEVDFIDMPGHERFVRAMVAGATGVHAALLVVAANEGVKPQTLEHLEIAGFLGVSRILPVISKADLAMPGQTAELAQSLAERVRDTGLQALPPQTVSIHDPAALAALGHAIAQTADEDDLYTEDAFPYLPIDRAFTIPGRGAVVTGTLRRGRLKADAPLVLAPSGVAVRVRGLQVHGTAANEAEPGQRVALNLRGVEPEDAPRGLAIAPPDQLPPSRWLSVQLRAAATAPPLKTGMRLVLLAGTFEVAARLRLLDADLLDPGGSAQAQLETVEPVALPARERFVLRVASPASTVAGGMVLDPLARRLRRRDPGVLAWLAALQAASPDEVLRLELEHAAAKGAPMSRLVALSGLSRSGVEGRLEAMGARRLGEELVISGEALAGLGRRLLATLQAQAEVQPNGLALRRLAALLPEASGPAIQAAAAALAATGRVRVEGGTVRLAPRRSDTEAAAARDMALAAELSRRLLSAALDAPSLAELSATPEARRALDRLVKSGEVVKTLDRAQKRELVFHRDALASARDRLRPALQPPGLTVSEAGALLGVSRKFSVPLLEYFDAVRFTRRLGDRRVLGPEAAR